MKPQFVGELCLTMRNPQTGEVQVLKTQAPLMEIEIDMEQPHNIVCMCSMCARAAYGLPSERTLTIRAKQQPSAGAAYTIETIKEDEMNPGYPLYGCRTETEPTYVDRVPSYHALQLDRLNVEQIAKRLKATSWKIELNPSDPEADRKVTFYGVSEQKGKKFVVHEGEYVVTNEGNVVELNPRVFTRMEFLEMFDVKGSTH